MTAPAGEPVSKGIFIVTVKIYEINVQTWSSTCLSYGPKQALSTLRMCYWLTYPRGDVMLHNEDLQSRKQEGAGKFNAGFNLY